ncbi:hypothetical protein CFAM422_001534 [Trichoderma lentiforme]|uniref:Uncharacterized protein n=1 Tax=Trichoderma lentiforme TaxID=1567552 RepID=A0A9P4XP46_9HYPO|nr:hypothetical protein CFAM422_001534 [Trichoderma lentiforme]
MPRGRRANEQPTGLFIVCIYGRIDTASTGAVSGWESRDAEVESDGKVNIARDATSKWKGR